MILKLLLPLIVCLSLRFSLADESFVDVETDLSHHHRHLLQSKDEVTEGTVSDNEINLENKKKGKFEPGEYLLGNENFAFITKLNHLVMGSMV